MILLDFTSAKEASPELSSILNETWQDAKPAECLEEGEVHVWRASLDVPADEMKIF